MPFQKKKVDEISEKKSKDSRKPIVLPMDVEERQDMQRISQQNNPQKSSNGQFKCPVDGCDASFDTAGMLNIHKINVHRLTSPKELNDPISLNSKKGVTMDAETMYIAQTLLNQGNFRDMNDLIKRGILNMHMGNIHHGGNMGSSKVDEVIDKIQEAKMASKAMDMLGRSEDNSDEIDMDSWMDKMMKVMEKKQKMEMLKSMSSGGFGEQDIFGVMQKIMMMNMMKEYTNPNRGQNNSEIQMLKDQLLELKRQDQSKQFETLIKEVVTKRNDDKGSFNDFVTAQKEVEAKYQSQMEAMKEKLKEEQFNRILDRQEEMKKEFESKLANAGQDPLTARLRSRMEEKLAQKFENVDEFLDGKKEKPISETIREVAETVFPFIEKPILEPIGRALERKMSGQSMPQQMPQQQYYPEQFQEQDFRGQPQPQNNSRQEQKPKSLNADITRVTPEDMRKFQEQYGNEYDD